MFSVFLYFVYFMNIFRMYVLCVFYSYFYNKEKHFMINGTIRKQISKPATFREAFPKFYIDVYK